MLPILAILLVVSSSVNLLFAFGAVVLQRLDKELENRGKFSTFILSYRTVHTTLMAALLSGVLKEWPQLIVIPQLGILLEGTVEVSSIH